MEKNREGLRLCKRCLLRDMENQEEYFQSMKDYIENLDSEIKTSETLYEERLKICRECDLLLQAMCRKCGCYVELRAAVSSNRCPVSRW